MSDHLKLRDALDRVEKMKRSYMGTLDPATAYMGVPVDCFDVIMATARETLPKTKMIPVWRVEYCYFDPDLRITSTTHEIEAVAILRATNLREEPEKYLCVHVTGPHRQEVPA